MTNNVDLNGRQPDALIEIQVTGEVLPPSGSEGNILARRNGKNAWTDPSDLSLVAVKTSASVGQTIVVKAVDADGKPIEWETADTSSGGAVSSVNGKTGDVVLVASDIKHVDGASTEEKVTQLTEEIDELKESGGVGVAVDATLSEAGKAADAKATGDAVSNLNAILNGGVANKKYIAPFELPGYQTVTGWMSDDPSASRTDYLSTNGYYKARCFLALSPSGYKIAFYDEGKKLLKDKSVLGSDTTDEIEVYIPSEAAYVIFSKYGDSYKEQYGELVANSSGLIKEVEDNKKEATLMIFDGAAFGAFAKWAAVGDSLSVGHTQDGGGTNHSRNIYYSWPQYMARSYGNECLNFGKSGATAKSWMSDADCYDKLIVSDNLCQAYVIGLGANDAENLDDYAGGLGTSADIDIENPSNNADSFYGWYGKVISTIRTAAPKARIFLLTLPYPRNEWVDSVSNVNAAIVEMGALFENTAVVDLSTNYNDYFKCDEIADMLVSGHFTATGYANIARVIAMALSDVMNANPTDYKDIPFIPFGTATELE